MTSKNGYPKTIEMSLSADTVRSKIEEWLRTMKVVTDSEDVKIKFKSNDPNTLNNFTVIPVELTLTKYKPKRLDLASWVGKPGGKSI